MGFHPPTDSASSAALRIATRCSLHDDTAALQRLQGLLEQAHTLPLPGAGDTLGRWQHFADIAAIDLTCVKLFESHTDALAILHELDEAHLIQDDALWAVWCAEPPGCKAYLYPTDANSPTVRLDGMKAWCSGADIVTHALVSCWDDAGRQQLVAVEMGQPGVTVTASGWQAVGMAGTASVDVLFNRALGVRVGSPGSYVDRPGFLHGAGGIAACWYGAACAIAQYVLDHARQRPDDVHALAHLGAIDVALTQAAGLLSRAASQIDATPDDGCALAIRRARLAVEMAVETVMLRAPRALGAGPLCKRAHLARLFADLPVFVRQSHAERDLAAHGRALSDLARFDPGRLS